MRKRWLGYAFISPWLLGFLIFTAYPFLASIYFSFTRYDIVSNPSGLVWRTTGRCCTTIPSFGNRSWLRSILRSSPCRSASSRE